MPVTFLYDDFLAPAPSVKNVGGGAGIPFRPPAFMAENPLFGEFLMIYFNYDFSLSLSLFFFFFNN